MTIVNSLNPEIIGNDVGAPFVKTAVLDQAHLGDIHGALGTFEKDDFGPRSTFSARLKTLIAIVSPGLIVMVGDNDAIWPLHAGRAELRHDSAADPGSVRQPGDSRAARHCHRRRAGGQLK